MSHQWTVFRGKFSYSNVYSAFQCFFEEIILVSLTNVCKLFKNAEKCRNLKGFLDYSTVSLKILKHLDSFWNICGTKTLSPFEIKEHKLLFVQYCLSQFIFNILRAAFLINLCRKTANTNCKKKKFVWNTFAQKNCMWNVGEIDKKIIFNVCDEGLRISVVKLVHSEKRNK